MMTIGLQTKSLRSVEGIAQRFAAKCEVPATKKFDNMHLCSPIREKNTVAIISEAALCVVSSFAVATDVQSNVFQDYRAGFVVSDIGYVCTIQARPARALEADCSIRGSGGEQRHYTPRKSEADHPINGERTRTPASVSPQRRLFMSLTSLDRLKPS